MESLSETKWDVVMCGTGLQNSLLALALSRSKKKLLHIDENDYYGGTEAAFSLQEVDEWVEKAKGENSEPFRNATLWKSDAQNTSESEKLSFSRAYTLTLSPQIIYTRSKLLAQLVSSKIYRQLEFQAVGNWWLFDAPIDSDATTTTLKRLPNGREDIFQDHGIDNRAKRSLMKFLKFVVDYENQPEIWEPHADIGMTDFLSSQFQLPPHLQTVIISLTLTMDPSQETLVKYALPRIARHLSSIGVFGPGFGAVLPKWGGGAEIAQVACRAGAVGGGVYVLGTGVKQSKIIDEQGDGSLTEVALSNGETVRTRHLTLATNSDHQTSPTTRVVSKIVAVVSSPLISLFMSSIEGAPLAAVSVVVFPPKSLSGYGLPQPNPVYIMLHSAETGECPTGQCVLYATSLRSSNSEGLLEVAISSFLKTAEDGEGKLLYSLYYEQQAVDSSLDLAFNDVMLEEVEKKWRTIIGDEDDATFMQFEEREGINDDDEFNDEY